MLLQFNEDLLSLHGIANVGVDLRDLAGDRGRDLSFHFHRFKYQ